MPDRVVDHLGNPVSSAAGLAGVDDFVAGFIGYHPRAANVLAAAEAEPGAVLANVFAGMLWMFLESPEAPAKAARFIARAETASGQANARERGHLAVLGAWSVGEMPRAIRAAEEVLAAHPRDLVALKLAQYFHFNRGDAPAMLRAAARVAATNRARAPFQAMLAFAYEQCHLLAEAEAAARAALEIDIREPWAHHALAHVMLTQGRIAEGRAFLEAMSPHWAGLNSFMSTHNWWHLALFRLSEGDAAAVCEIYDRHVWGIDPGYSQDQVGAVSLLARMEFAGIDVGLRWSGLAPHLAARAADTVEPFLTIQYLYGLARANSPQADDLMRAVVARAGAAPPDSRAAWAEVALPACEAVLAFLRDDPATAVARLQRALPRMAEIGGSHAQRDLFEQLLIAALMRAGRDAAAQQMLELRRRADPGGVPLNRLLAQVYDRLGLPEEAEKALARTDRP